MLKEFREKSQKQLEENLLEKLYQKSLRRLSDTSQEVLWTKSTKEQYGKFRLLVRLLYAVRMYPLFLNGDLIPDCKSSKIPQGTLKEILEVTLKTIMVFTHVGILEETLEKN